MEIKKIIGKLLFGNREEAKIALKTLSKMPKIRWRIFVDAFKDFERAASDENRLAFARALRYAFRELSATYFKECSSVVLALLTSPSARLRTSAVALGRDLFWFSGGAEAAPMFDEFIKRLEKFRDKNCSASLDKFDYIEELPPSVCKSAETLFFELSENRGDVRGLRDLAIPVWVDCTWKRVPCGKKTCLFCGQTARVPKSEEEVFKNLEQGLESVLEVLKKETSKLGLDFEKVETPKFTEPPQHEKFPLWREVEAWNKYLYAIEARASEFDALWLETEAAADLFWYANILAAKVYHQLCNRWHIKQGNDFGNFDFEYTGKVLNEISGIIKKSLAELSLWNIEHKGELLLVAANFVKLENKIKKI